MSVSMKLKIRENRINEVENLINDDLELTSSESESDNE